MKIGYLGPRGTFSEQAALTYTKNSSDIELVKYGTIYDVLDAVDNGEVEECVVPLENSIEGAVTSTMDMLIFKADLFIKMEIIIPVWEDFLVKTCYNGEEIAKILSHPQALAQCAGFIRKNYPNSITVPVNSTAEAARIVAESNENIASLSPKHAAEVYGLKALHSEVQDDSSNQTRFVVVTKKRPKEKAEHAKTSIVFSTQNKPGDLYRILDIISIWDINMTKIESRPMKHQLGSYVFFIDLEAKNLNDLESAIKMVARKTSYFKFLGSYPVLK